MFELHPQLAKDSVLVVDLPLCQVRLALDANYPWLILVPKHDSARDIIDLSEAQQAQLWLESAHVSKVMREYFAPDKLNIAALGNMVPQLHIHHVARYQTDLAWPAPIWGKCPATSYSAEQLVMLQTDLAQRIERKY